MNDVKNIYRSVVEEDARITVVANNGSECGLIYATEPDRYRGARVVTCALSADGLRELSHMLADAADVLDAGR